MVRRSNATASRSFRSPRRAGGWAVAAGTGGMGRTRGWAAAAA